jgi:peptide/nickel transport system permease protein
MKFLSKTSLSTRIGIFMVLFIFCISIFGSFLAPNDPNEFIGEAFALPFKGFPLGLDSYGRDSLSRFLVGGKYALMISIVGYLFGAMAGLFLGLFSVYSRGKTDSALAWFSEVLIGFPSLVLMLLLVAALGPSFWVLVLALSMVNLPRVFRLVRSAAQVARESSYVEIAESRGEGKLFIMFREMSPSVMPPFLVDAGVRIPASILLVASLSFLGLGIQPPASDWGLIISENRMALTINPLSVTLPILSLAILMIGINLALDGLQEKRKDSFKLGIE